MICGHANCGAAIIALDRAFVLDHLAYNLTRIRLICVYGHTTYDPPTQALEQMKCKAHGNPQPCANCLKYQIRARHKLNEPWPCIGCGESFLRDHSRRRHCPSCRRCHRCHAAKHKPWCPSLKQRKRVATA